MYGVGGPAAAPYGQHPPPQSTQPQGGAAGYGYAPQQGGGAYAAPPLQQGGAQAYNQQPQAQYAAYPGAQAPPHHQGYGGGGGYGAPPHPGYGAPGGGGGFGPAGRFLAVKLRGLPFGVRDFEVAMFLVGRRSLYTGPTRAGGLVPGFGAGGGAARAKRSCSRGARDGKGRDGTGRGAPAPGSRSLWGPSLLISLAPTPRLRGGGRRCRGPTPSTWHAAPPTPLFSPLPSPPTPTLLPPRRASTPWTS
jgi:hypothetical protein